MNQYFYEHAAREKLGQLRAEGRLSQEYSQSRSPNAAVSHSFRRAIAVAASVLAVILILAH